MAKIGGIGISRPDCLSRVMALVIGGAGVSVFIFAFGLLLSFVLYGFYLF